MDGYDVVVLGGGPAGCAVAARLSEDPARTVCLVEAGPDHGPRADGGWPAELLDPTAIPDTHDWRDDEGSLPSAWVIGGCSAHNACAVSHGAGRRWSRAWRAHGTRWARRGRGRRPSSGSGTRASWRRPPRRASSADASIAPHRVRAGTHLAALAVAERVAELLRAGDRLSP